VIIITIELVDAKTGQSQELGRGQIWNTGKGTQELGEYQAIFKFDDRIWMSNVARFRRQELTAWHLLARALRAAGLLAAARLAEAPAALV